MRKKRKNGYESLLPNDEDLIKRSIIWGTVLQKYTEEEEQEVEHLQFNSNNLEINNEMSDESVDPFQFETNENESDFDVQDTLNKTKKYVEKRKEKWHSSGLDQIMDSFNLNTIQNKVGNWLFNDSNLFLNNSVNKTSFPDLFINQEFEIQNHRFYSDKSSVDSVDTAKYILASRKRTMSKVTTMTIKRYCYSNRKRTNECELQPNEAYLGARKRITLESCSNHSRQNNVNESNSNNCCKSSKRKNDKKYLKICRANKQIDTSISSSTTKDVSDTGCKLFSDCDKKSNPKNGLLPKNRKKISRKSSKSRYMFQTKDCNDSSSSSEISISNRRQKTFKKSLRKSKTRNSLKIDQENKCNKTAQSEIYFNENNFVNSTAIIKSNSVNDDQNKLSTVIENKESFQETNKYNHNKNETTLKNVSCSPIVLYEPDNSNLVSSIGIDKFVVTKKLLMDKIGEDLTKKFLNGETEIVREFDTCSKIIFYPPENESNNSSESDFFEKVFKQKGRLVEVVNFTL